MPTIEDLRQGLTVYLRGGLGNQLFMVSAGLEQARRLGCPLFLDTTHFLSGEEHPRTGETPRHYELSGLNIDAQVIGNDSPLYSFEPSSRKDRLLMKSKRLGLSVYNEEKGSYESRIEKIRPGTVLNGYFGSPKYFENTTHLIFQMLETYRVDNFDNRSSSSKISVHVRRGDYLSPSNQRFHGLVGKNFFKKGVEIAKSLYPSSDVVIFSDSPEFVDDEFSGTFQYIMDTSLGLTSLETMLLLSDAKAIVMSNSTFSWWAAWLMTYRNSGLVVAPRPWHVNLEVDPVFILPSWFSLGK